MNVLPQTPLDWVLVAVAVATGIVFAVAMQDFFVEGHVHDRRIRAIQDLSLALAIVHLGVLLMRGSAGPGWAIAGITLYVVATLLFLAALEASRRVPLPRAFVDDPMPKALITSGPFAVIRHPFYLAYSLAWIAAPVATHGPIIAGLSLIAIAGYVIAARREEQQLEDRFGEAYRNYKLGTGMVVPPLARLIRASR
jgi:protein-S-isoprenylcysteine O-methyltransferase Ste14